MGVRTRDRAGRSRLDTAFRALASAQRREILRILGEQSGRSDKTCCAPDELCACKLSDRLGLAPSTISHHMTLLREARLVDARKDGSWVYYRLCRDNLRAVAEELETL
jgi:DNA-binding transcriptional ArsR family regulator